MTSTVALQSCEVKSGVPVASVGQVTRGFGLETRPHAVEPTTASPPAPVRCPVPAMRATAYSWARAQPPAGAGMSMAGRTGSGAGSTVDEPGHVGVRDVEHEDVGRRDGGRVERAAEEDLRRGLRGKGRQRAEVVRVELRLGGRGVGRGGDDDEARRLALGQVVGRGGHRRRRIEFPTVTTSDGVDLQDVRRASTQQQTQRNKREFVHDATFRFLTFVMGPSAKSVEEGASAAACGAAPLRRRIRKTRIPVRRSSP